MDARHGSGRAIECRRDLEIHSHQACATEFVATVRDSPGQLSLALHTPDVPDRLDECSRAVRACDASALAKCLSHLVRGRVARARLQSWHKGATNPPWS